MIINHNMMAMNTNRQLGINGGAVSKSMEKLSSGLRINRAGDDAAGLSISEKMRGQIRGLEQASRNAQDGISLIQTAEGALNETHSILQRMRELTIQAANDTNITTDRAAIKAELNQLSAEVTRIAKDTEFNKQTLMSAAGKSFTFQVGANSGQHIKVTLGCMTAGANGLAVSAVSVGSVADANAATTTIQAALEEVSGLRSRLGAVQNRLEHTINNLDTGAENLQAAESRIRDVNMAKEMMGFTKNNILQQAANAMLAQANQAPQGVLQLLR